MAGNEKKTVWLLPVLDNLDERKKKERKKKCMDKGMNQT